MATETATAVVTVRTNGDRVEVPWTGGMTVEAAYTVAGLTPGWRSKLFVNGEPARSTNIIEPGDTVTIAPRVRNG